MKKMALLITSFILTLPLAAEVKIVAFAGSTREGSYNKKLVQEAAAIAREMGATVTVVDLKDYPMPFYDGDLEAKEGLPANAKRFRDLLVQSDAIIIASPQYNRSIPGMLKNALDWASRSEEGGGSRAAYQGKKIALLSASPGPKGGAGALVHLRGILEDVKGDVIKEQFSLAAAGDAFDEKGLKSETAKAELKQVVQKLFPAKAS